jgi:hypothetical protein
VFTVGGNDILCRFAEYFFSVQHCFFLHDFPCRLVTVCVDFAGCPGRYKSYSPGFLPRYSLGLFV